MQEKDVYQNSNNLSGTSASSTETAQNESMQDVLSQGSATAESPQTDVQNDVQTDAQTDIPDDQQFDDFNEQDNAVALNAKCARKSYAKLGTRAVAYIGVSTAMVFVATLIGFSSSQFYFNFGDSIILMVSALLGPISAMIAGGLGAFFADLAVYPATMVYTLVIKAIEGLVAGILFKLIFRHYDKLALKSDLSKRQKATKIALSFATMLFCTSIMMCGYLVCQTFFYGTLSSALVALPMDSAQACVSTAVAFIALYPLKLINFRGKLQVHI